MHAVIAQHLTMVGSEDNQRIVGNSELIQLVEDLPYEVIDLLHHAVIDRAHLTDIMGILVVHLVILERAPLVGGVFHRIVDAFGDRDFIRRVHAVVGLLNKCRRMRRIK